jgi:hypothetical protein
MAVRSWPNKEEECMTTIISLFGGPGAGKSTTSAGLFAQLKQDGHTAEYVQEWVKMWAYENKHIEAYDQFYIFGKQMRKESCLLGKVDYVVTDSPVLLSLFYGRKYCPPAVALAIEASVKAYFSLLEEGGHKQINFLLKRQKAYNPVGRYQTEQEAVAFDGEIESLLTELSVPFCKKTSLEVLSPLFSWRPGQE